MSSSKPYASGCSGDPDYVADFREAADDRAEQVADEFREMMASDRASQMWDEIKDSLGVENVGHLRAVADHVRFMVDDPAVGSAICKLVPSAVVRRGPANGWKTCKFMDNELWVPGKYVSHLGTRVEPAGQCFWDMCRELGVNVDPGVNSPLELTTDQLHMLRSSTVDLVLVVRDILSVDHYRNHVQVVRDMSPFDWVALGCNSNTSGRLFVSCMTVDKFLQRGTAWFASNYYSEGHSHVGSGFGDMVGGVGPGLVPTGVAVGSGVRGRSGAPESVRAESLGPGSNNVTRGVVRRTKRRMLARSSYDYGGGPNRNYSVSPGVLFNNFSEVALDAISPEYAQEVLEAVFDAWGLPTHSPDVMKYAEDLVFTFLIASTASDKADYNRVYDIPSPVGELDADFKVLSDMLGMRFGITRRQLTRGLSDRLRAFARHDDNAELRAAMADRAGCQLQFADLAFDGSTHCRGLGPTEKAFVRTLEARNLFEADGVMAVDASNKLLMGFNQRQTQRLQ